MSRPTVRRRSPQPDEMRHLLPKWVADSSLTIVMLAMFLACFAGQAVTGWMVDNDERHQHAQPALSFSAYLTSGDFFEATFENWESEFLQMALFILLSAHLVQRGSAESAKPEDERDPATEAAKESVRADSPWPVRRGGIWKTLYGHSLSAAFAVLFLASFVLHALGGRDAHNEEQALHGEPPVSTIEYVTTSKFWFESLQNWQSEFLSVAAIVVLSIFLREKDSPESKPLAAPHRKTGAD